MFMLALQTNCGASVAMLTYYIQKQAGDDVIYMHSYNTQTTVDILRSRGNKII